MSESRLLAKLLRLDRDVRLAALLKLSEEERHEVRHHWKLWARTQQLPPETSWRLWLILAGRGFGKTRAGAEWVRQVAENDGNARIALVAASLSEARAVMVEGESGLLEVTPPGRAPLSQPRGCGRGRYDAPRGRRGAVAALAADAAGMTSPFTPLAARLIDAARTLAEARLEQRRLTRRDPALAWRKASLVWPRFSKG